MCCIRFRDRFGENKAAIDVNASVKAMTNHIGCCIFLAWKQSGQGLRSGIINWTTVSFRFGGRQRPLHVDISKDGRYGKEKWMFRGVDVAASKALAEKASTDLVVAQLLYQRGITDPEYISGFLDPKFSDLREPNLLPNLSAAAERVYRAIIDKNSDHHLR